MRMRPFAEQDLLQVVAIEERIARHSWSRSMFAEELRLNSPALVLEGETGVLGYALARNQIAFWDLLLIGVAPEWQRQGWGRRLLEELLRLAIIARVERMVLEVRPSNLPAIHLYKATGFVAQGVRKEYYQKPQVEDALIMVRELSSKQGVE